MAKELPYFKFEPNQWENGLIQMCSRESKGLFIDIVSIYWQRLGDLPYRYVLQKLCGGNANALQELCDENIIKVEDGNIVIFFLDEQLNEFKVKSKKASESAKARWEKHNKNSTLDANAMQTHSEGNAIREEKRKEDKKDNNIYIPTFEEFKDYALEKKPDVDLETLRFKYESWVENDWHTGTDKPRQIKNWKTTLLNTLPHLKTKSDLNGKKTGSAVWRELINQQK